MLIDWQTGTWASAHADVGQAQVCTMRIWVFYVCIKMFQVPMGHENSVPRQYPLLQHKGAGSMRVLSQCNVHNNVLAITFKPHIF